MKIDREKLEKIAALPSETEQGNKLSRTLARATNKDLIKLFHLAAKEGFFDTFYSLINYLEKSDTWKECVNEIIHAQYNGKTLLHEIAQLDDYRSNHDEKEEKQFYKKLFARKYELISYLLKTQKINPYSQDWDGKLFIDYIFDSLHTNSLTNKAKTALLQQLIKNHLTVGVTWGNRAVLPNNITLTNCLVIGSVRTADHYKYHSPICNREQFEQKFPTFNDHKKELILLRLQQILVIPGLNADIKEELKACLAFASVNVNKFVPWLPIGFLIYNTKQLIIEKNIPPKEKKNSVLMDYNSFKKIWLRILNWLNQAAIPECSPENLTWGGIFKYYAGSETIPKSVEVILGSEEQFNNWVKNNTQYWCEYPEIKNIHNSWHKTLTNLKDVIDKYLGQFACSGNGEWFMVDESNVLIATKIEELWPKGCEINIAEINTPEIAPIPNPGGVNFSHFGKTNSSLPNSDPTVTVTVTQTVNQTLMLNI